MEGCCNWTLTNGWGFLCMSFRLQILFGVISAILVLSLSWNIFFCVSKCCSGRTCRPRIRQRSTRQMEENPIYGNVSYMQTSFTEVEHPHSSLTSSSMTYEQRVNSDSQSKTQDCYANLTLKPPRLQSGCSSPQIQYSDVVHLEEPDKEDEGNADTVSTMSDLYASVQNQRTKTINNADSREDYANHL
ncbi:signaling threshold-regulating transmembrane adapter 1-like [Thunnus maccoyii]|uniref:signaling threshold-regulating transmembrane adapter 1-like n=1 Tax=Thunnus maccoyii TaxID=8240 RepID=UPI001C4C53AF|nr:signaling threshold-regulating transmembrane adapter 1-like [Thunnus maccoyii]